MPQDTFLNILHTGHRSLSASLIQHLLHYLFQPLVALAAFPNYSHNNNQLKGLFRLSGYLHTMLSFPCSRSISGLFHQHFFTSLNAAMKELQEKSVKF